MEKIKLFVRNKSLAVVMVGFLATGLGLSSAGVAQASTGTSQAETFQCPDDLTLVSSIIVSHIRKPNSTEYFRRKIYYTCSNSNKTIIKKFLIIYRYNSTTPN